MDPATIILIFAGLWANEDHCPAEVRRGFQELDGVVRWTCQRPADKNIRWVQVGVEQLPDGRVIPVMQPVNLFAK